MQSIFDILLIPMGFILRIAYSITNNYLLAIMLFTLVMEILLLPLGIKQQKNQVKQATFAPRIQAIRKKYAGRNDQATQQKMQNEIMELYRSEKFNPAGGCGTLLIQFPIIIALFNVVTNPLRYICNMPAAEITALTTALQDKLTATSHYPQYNLINYLNENPSLISQYYNHAPSLETIKLPDFKIGAIDLSMTPSFNPFNWLVIIPVLTFAVMIISQKIMKKFTYQSPENEAAQNNMSMKIMTWTMPLISVYFEFNMPAIIGVYWVFRNILSTVIRIILAKVFPVPQYTEEDYKEAERQATLSNKQRKREQKANGEHKFVRSLHYIDDEDYITRHAEELSEANETKSDKSASKMAKAPLKEDEKPESAEETKENTEK